MKVQWGKSAKDNSLSMLHVEAGSSAAENAGTAYQSPSLIAVGGNAESISILSAILNLVLGCMLLKVPTLIENKQDSLKRTAVFIAVINCFTWLPLIFVMLLGKNISPLLIIALWVINMVPTVLVYPLRDHWMASMVPTEKMGRYLSKRSIIAGASYLSTFVIMGFMIEVTGQQAKNYAIILALAFLASSLSALIYVLMKSPAPTPKPEAEKNVSLFNFLKDARKSHLGTFIIFVSLYMFAVNISSPMFSSYILNDLKYSMGIYTAMIACEYLARCISLTFWGKMVDRSGALRLMSIVAYFIPLVPILWIFSTNIAYLLSIQLLSGVLWAAFDLSAQTFLYKAVPAEQRLRYIVYYKSLASFSVGFGAITGALLLNRIFPIHGSHILGIFIISGVLRLVVARTVLPRLTPQGIPDAVVHPELATELAYTQIQPKLGLYYHPESWRNFSKKAARFGNNVLDKTVGRISVSKSGLYYKPATWTEYLTKAGMTVDRENANDTSNGIYNKPGAWNQYMARNGLKPEQAKVEAEPVSDGLYNKPEDWTDYEQRHGGSRIREQPVAQHEGIFNNPHLWADFQKQLGIAPKTREPEHTREALYLNPEHWTEYAQHAVVMNEMTARTGSDSNTIRQPIYGNPELWAKYQKDVARQQKAKTTLQPVSHKGLYYKPDNWQKYKEHTSATKLNTPRGTPVTGTAMSNAQRAPLFAQVKPAAATKPAVRRIRPAPSAI